MTKSKPKTFLLILIGFTLTTVRATDPDTYKRDGKFDLKIISVSPEPHDLEFTLEQIKDTEIGTISFKGCLDHEVRISIHLK